MTPSPNNQGDHRPMTTPERPDLNWPRAVAAIGVFAITAATILGLAAILAGVITHA